MKSIITVSREFGSGGRSIAKEVAKKLGYEYFDVEMIERIAQTSGLDPEVMENAEEFSARKSLFGYAFIGRGTKETSMENYLWNKQRDMILELAEKGNCVIVGRCADYVLRDSENALHVFVHADMDYRAKRIVRLYGETNETPEKRLTDKDKMRKANYEYYTDREWGLAQNYDLTLNSGKLGQERCVDIICGLAMAE
ncbi:MAG: cytidylate kinase-like family protein [bacterium]|nr:cytidylate kinase-like family protein [bacterium]